MSGVVHEEAEGLTEADGWSFVQPDEKDWQEFLRVAGDEGWRVPAGEMALFRGPCADNAVALRRDGRFAGLVTLMNHGRSAWIGNLIVPATLRGRGYGKLLLERAIELLQQRARSIWLTASEDGYPLYRRRGFQTLGQVERWVRAEGGDSGHAIPRNELGAGFLEALDMTAWGERRALMTHLVTQATVVRCGANVALLQREPGMQILGPWYDGSRDEKDRRGLLDAAVALAAAGEELVLDLRAGAVAEEALIGAGFLLRGRTRLMARGDVGGIDLRSLVSFASLGSMG